MNPDTSEDICYVITTATDLSVRPRNLTAESTKTFSNGIHEPTRSFANIFEPINEVLTIRFNQKVRGREPPGTCRKKKTFSNINNFSVNSRLFIDFLVELKQNIPVIIFEYSFNPTFRRFNRKRFINIDLDKSYGSDTQEILREGVSARGGGQR